MTDLAIELINHSRLNIETLEKVVEDIASKISELSNKGDYSSPEYIDLTKKQAKIETTLNYVKDLTKAVSDYKETQALLSDSDLGEMAKVEIKELENKINDLTSKLEHQIRTPLKNDDKKALFEIRPGVGGAEASLFAEEIYRMYTKYCNEKKYALEVFSIEYDQQGGISEALFKIDEPDSFGLFRFEAGVHRVQRVPATEAAGRIHTSTVTVAILPEVTHQDIDVKAEDLRIVVYRSSGPGGQSVNTTDSAVRITHIPTGITVACQNGKSQHKNKDMAMGILLSKLSEIEENKRSSEENAIRSAAIGSGDRSGKIRTYNFPQSRVTDHRVNQSWYNIEQIMNGYLDDIIDFVTRELRSE
jgi:peptide chain release factor 1